MSLPAFPSPETAPNALANGLFFQLTLAPPSAAIPDPSLRSWFFRENGEAFPYGSEAPPPLPPFFINHLDGSHLVNLPPSQARSLLILAGFSERAWPAGSAELQRLAERDQRSTPLRFPEIILAAIARDAPRARLALSSSMEAADSLLALNIACELGDLEIALALIPHCDLSASEPPELSWSQDRAVGRLIRAFPLCEAAGAGSARVTQALLDAGAPPCANLYKKTAFAYEPAARAAEGNHAAILQTLFDASALLAVQGALPMELFDEQTAVCHHAKVFGSGSFDAPAMAQQSLARARCLIEAQALSAAALAPCPAPRKPAL